MQAASGAAGKASEWPNCAGPAAALDDIEGFLIDDSLVRILEDYPHAVIDGDEADIVGREKHLRVHTDL